MKVEVITTAFITPPSSVVIAGDKSYIEKSVTDQYIIEAVKSNYIGGDRMTYGEIIADGYTVSVSSDAASFVSVDNSGNVSGLQKRDTSEFWKTTTLTLDIDGITADTKVKVRTMCPLNDPGDAEGDGDLTTAAYGDNWGCYYLGALGQSCDDVCTTGSMGAGVGAYDQEVTEEYIGSEYGTASHCVTAFYKLRQKFGTDFINIAENMSTDASGWGTGVGCMLTSSKSYRFILPTTTSSASHANYQRVCSCKAGGS